MWMRIYKLPSEKRNRATGECFANKVGMFLDYDDSDISGWTNLFESG